MNNRIEEKYIIIIARELAKALKAVHDADIIHRDVKGEYLCPALLVRRAQDQQGTIEWRDTNESMI